jgi:hypothetical protein
MTIVTAASAASAGAQLSCSSPERVVEQAQDHDERRGLGGSRHERRDRRGAPW